MEFCSHFTQKYILVLASHQHISSSLALFLQPQRIPRCHLATSDIQVTQCFASQVGFSRSSPPLTSGSALDPWAFCLCSQLWLPNHLLAAFWVSWHTLSVPGSWDGEVKRQGSDWRELSAWWWECKTCGIKDATQLPTEGADRTLACFY